MLLAYVHDIDVNGQTLRVVTTVCANIEKVSLKTKQFVSKKKEFIRLVNAENYNLTFSVSRHT